MRPFKRPSTLISHYPQCLHRNTSTAITHRQRPKDQKGMDQSLRVRAQILRTRIREARVARREDWILGPLAPHRDKGDNAYGTMSLGEMRPLKGGMGRAVLTERNRGGARISGRRRGKGKKVGMGWSKSLIYEGDRVAVLSDQGPESREFGRIGTVSKVMRAEREVEIEDMNLVDVKLPPEQLARDPESPPIQSFPLGIPLSSVRLVAPIRDPNTGIETDKIISRLIPLPSEAKTAIRREFAAGTITEEDMRRRLRSRSVPGSKDVYGSWVEIPIPPKSGRDKKPPRSEREEHENDTLRYEVEETTWTPTLLRAPMPGTVIDELRNKYSRLRTRHTADYEQRLKDRAARQAAYEAWVATGGGGIMVTPRQEAREAARQRAKEKGRPALEREVLERIGEAMASRGVSLTERRRRAMVRNLQGKRVVRWGDGVDGQGKGKQSKPVLEQEGSENDDEQHDDDDGEGGGEGEHEEEQPQQQQHVPIENQQGRDEQQRPSL
ncbi:hypothetical protein BDR22DRAFT_872599 [Usnea florida]